MDPPAPSICRAQPADRVLAAHLRDTLGLVTVFENPTYEDAGKTCYHLQELAGQDLPCYWRGRARVGGASLPRRRRCRTHQNHRLRPGLLGSAGCGDDGVAVVVVAVVLLLQLSPLPESFLDARRLECSNRSGLYPLPCGVCAAVAGKITPERRRRANSRCAGKCGETQL